MTTLKTFTRKSFSSVLVDLIGVKVNVRVVGDSGCTTSILSSVGLDYITLTCKGSVDPLIIAIKNIITITRYRGDD